MSFIMKKKTMNILKMKLLRIITSYHVDQTICFVNHSFITIEMALRKKNVYQILFFCSGLANTCRTCTHTFSLSLFLPLCVSHSGAHCTMVQAPLYCAMPFQQCAIKLRLSQWASYLHENKSKCKPAEMEWFGKTPPSSIV